jgi:hypothetical protein
VKDTVPALISNCDMGMYKRCEGKVQVSKPNGVQLVLPQVRVPSKNQAPSTKCRGVWMGLRVSLES